MYNNAVYIDYQGIIALMLKKGVSCGQTLHGAWHIHAGAASFGAAKYVWLSDYPGVRAAEPVGIPA